MKYKKVYIAAFNVEAVDTTVAGDTFCGAYAVVMVEGKSEKECLDLPVLKQPSV